MYYQELKPSRASLSKVSFLIIHSSSLFNYYLKTFKGFVYSEKMRLFLRKTTANFYCLVTPVTKTTQHNK